jgi:hypothetical protein
MLFGKIIAGYSQDHMRQIQSVSKMQFLNVQAGGTYIYHYALKGYVYFLFQIW